MNYEDFIASKRLVVPPCGFEPKPIRATLFPFQADIVRWAVQRGRAAVFADTGTGKTRIELEWARQVVEHTGGNVLILAPLAVTTQTHLEAQRIGIETNYRRSQEAVTPGITLANYEMLEAFDPSAWAGVVLDESSILKSLDGKTRNAIIESFKHTPYRLACTATPAPNDHTELGNHAEFLGAMTRTEMLATFFVHDGAETQTWRLKRHAEDAFWSWICSWSVAIRKPSDLGYDDAGYDLPPLHIKHHTVASDTINPREMGMLFAMPARSLMEQRRAKRASLADRVRHVVSLVGAPSADPWVIWCELNDEQDALEAAFGDRCVSIQGADSRLQKISKHEKWISGQVQILITKPACFGWGMNWQHCARMAFVGVTHSFETFYQSVRRAYRYGQKRAVEVHVVASEMESEVVSSLRRKEADAARMVAAMVSAMRETQIANVRSLEREVVAYVPRVEMALPAWLRSEAA